MWKIVYTKAAKDDYRELVRARNQAWLETVDQIENVIEQNPRGRPPDFKELKGDFTGLWSRRISLKHRYVYVIYDQEQTVKVVSIWGHFT